MSSYLFIVKSELPLVIQAFLGKQENTGWVLVISQWIIISFFFLFFHILHSGILISFIFLYWLSLREWFLDGNYLIIIVSTCVILPLALMKQLGMFSIVESHILVLIFPSYSTSCIHYLFTLVYTLYWSGSCCMTPWQIISLCFFFPGYLGYTSGFSLSCMVFFLISVSH